MGDGLTRRRNTESATHRNPRRFGSGTLTNRSDGSTTRRQKVGSGSLTTERDQNGKMITGTTQPLGSGTFSTDKPGGSSSQSSKAVTR